jgi:dephospho-CoA kinase
MDKNKNILKLGVTGGIGSGKTSVCRVFNVFGIPVFSADPVAREIMENDTYVKENINSISGKNMYENGYLNRAKLAELIFNDNSLLAKVNALVHPVVFENFRNWTLQQQAPYVIMEAAILFESGASKLVDKVATVVAPIEERIQRVVLSNKLTKEQILDRIRNQMNDDERIRLSDYVIRNAENDMIIPAILEIHGEILKYIKEAN